MKGLHMSKQALIPVRISETAKIADIHLPLRPGTAALHTRAMIAIILQEGWQNTAYLAHHGNELSNYYGRIPAQYDAQGDFKQSSGTFKSRIVQW